MRRVPAIEELRPVDTAANLTLDGIELLGWHLHFASQDRSVGGHVLSSRLHRGLAYIDNASDLHVELPPAVDVHHGGAIDQDALRRMESE